MFKDPSSTSKNKTDEQPKESFMLPGIKLFFDSILGQEPDFDEYMRKCPSIDVMNQINYSYIWLAGQSQSSHVDLFNELISPKKWLRLGSVTEYFSYTIDTDDDLAYFVLMSHNMSQAFFEVLGGWSKASIILIYDDDEQMCWMQESRDSTFSTGLATVIRCSNLRMAKQIVSAIVGIKLMGFGNHCYLEAQTKRLAKEYYRKAVEKLNCVDNFTVERQIQEIIEKLNVSITTNKIYTWQDN